MMRLVGEVGPEGWQGRNQSIKEQGSRIQDKDRGSRTRIRDQGSRIKGQGSRIKDQGSRSKDQESKMKAGGRTRRLAGQDPENQGSRIKDLVLAQMSILEEIRT